MAKIENPHLLKKIPKNLFKVRENTPQNVAILFNLGIL